MDGQGEGDLPDAADRCQIVVNVVVGLGADPVLFEGYLGIALCRSCHFHTVLIQNAAHFGRSHGAYQFLPNISMLCRAADAGGKDRRWKNVRGDSAGNLDVWFMQHLAQLLNTDVGVSAREQSCDRDTRGSFDELRRCRRIGAPLSYQLPDRHAARAAGNRDERRRHDECAERSAGIGGFAAPLAHRERRRRSCGRCWKSNYWP